ncbi:MAG: UPF0182 family protein [Chloroflexota bacterium]
MTFFSDLDKAWSKNSSGPRRPRSQRRPVRRGLIVIGAIILFFILAGIVRGIYTEWLWFGSLGFSTIYTTILSTRVWLFFGGALIFLAFLSGNLFLARRLSPPVAHNVPIGQAWVLVRRVLDLIVLGVAIFISFIFGLVTAGSWETVLRFSNATNFGTTEPLLGRDVAFYIFNLPFYNYVHGWLMWAIILTLIITAAIYSLNLGFRRSLITTTIKGHLLALGAAVFFLIAWGYRLKVFDLLYSERGVVFGASYTDVHAQQLAYIVIMVTAIISGLLLLANLLRRWRWRGSLPLPIGLWIVAIIIFGGIYPAIVQRFQVEPNELARERPYIERNIQMTRLAFGLDYIEERDIPFEAAPTKQDIANNSTTINNIRLWDYRPMRDTYNQIQSIRPYYDFLDVDVDRYIVDGSYRQVLLSARELSPEKLVSEAQTWLNQRLQYTHGYGVALSPVNEISQEGLPHLWVQDIPPIGKMSIERPEIYYGESTKSYVIVNAEAEEFDYPKGNTNVYTKYAGESGIRLNSFLRRAAYAWELGDFNILISGELTPESQLLYRRNIQERVRHLAPFLKLDRDPYIVIDNGQLLWVQDAYTTSDRYPYSQPTAGINYIRNSVKIVINAYDGSVTFYLIDPEDAIAQTYAAIFPSLFTPIEAMPPSLRAHLRYPSDLFQIYRSPCTRPTI